MEFVKRGRAGALMALVVFAMGCGEATEPEVDVSAAFVSQPTELTLRYGQEARVGGVLRVSFAQVTEDSRCPVDAVCVWEGNAGIEIGVAVGSGPTYPLRLNTAKDPKRVEWQGLTITLLEVQPAPRASEATRLEDYSIKLRIEAKQ